MPELITMLATTVREGYGSFSSAAEVVAFINSAANQKPLHIMAATENDSKWNGNDLIHKIEAHYVDLHANDPLSRPNPIGITDSRHGDLHRCLKPALNKLLTA